MLEAKIMSGLGINAMVENIKTQLWNVKPSVSVDLHAEHIVIAKRSKLHTFVLFFDSTGDVKLTF